MYSSLLAYFLWCGCLVGFCGIHRFYLNRWLTGFLWLFTFGLLGFGQLIDLFIIPTMVWEENASLRRYYGNRNQNVNTNLNTVNVVVVHEPQRKRRRSAAEYDE
jgi:TM2 domain-containing membrane protein YozV